MRSQFIKQVLKTYGTSQILRDHNLTVVDVMDILDDLQFIDLEIYVDEAEKDAWDNIEAAAHGWYTDDHDDS